MMAGLRYQSLQLGSLFLLQNRIISV